MKLMEQGTRGKNIPGRGKNMYKSTECAYYIEDQQESNVLKHPE